MTEKQPKQPWYIPLAAAPAPEPVTLDASQLSDKNRILLLYVLRGFTSKEIGTELNIRKDSVERHRERVLGKLGLHGIANLTRGGVSAGITPLPIGDPLQALIQRYQTLSPNQRQIMAVIAKGEIDSTESPGVRSQIHRLKQKMGTPTTPETIRAWLALKQEADRLMVAEMERVAMENKAKNDTAQANVPPLPIAIASPPEEPLTPWQVMIRQATVPEKAASSFTTRVNKSTNWQRG